MSSFLDEILKSNETNKEHIVAVSYNGIETSDATEIRKMKGNFKTEATYDIHYEYDEEGYINKAIIGAGYENSTHNQLDSMMEKGIN